jgi:O-methyltransferase
MLTSYFRHETNKSHFRKMLSSAGYTVRRTTDEVNNWLLFQNFSNLAQAYEFRLNAVSDDSAIEANNERARLLGRVQGTPPSEAYFILQSLAKSRSTPGDVCEFGVGQGETSALIANEIRGTSNILHQFDSFEGLPSPTEKDQLKDDIFHLGTIKAYAGTMACPEDMVRSRLNAIAFPSERFVIHKGFVDQVIKTDKSLPNCVSFAYVDFDFYDPMRQALAFLHERMPIGGVMVVDDYDWFSTGAKTAVDEFLSERNLNVAHYRCHVPDKAFGCFAVIERV